MAHRSFRAVSAVVRRAICGVIYGAIYGVTYGGYSKTLGVLPHISYPISRKWSGVEASS